MSDPLRMPFTLMLNNAIQRKLDDRDQQNGLSLPCSVVAVSWPMVTVSFDLAQSENYTIPQVTMPVAMSRYVKMPIKVGDMGLAVSASVRLGGISGLGTGTAPLVTPSNLGGLVFLPVSNTSWTTDDPLAVVISGPDGIILKNDTGTTKVILTPTSLTLEQGSASITISGGNITVTGTLIINGTAFMDHKHLGVTSGTSETGGVGP